MFFSQMTDLFENEFLVQMIIAPINPSDLIPITGAYSHRTVLPSFIGYEGVGIVKDVGNQQNSNLLGKRVLLVDVKGTWQEFLKVKRDNIIIIPDDIPNIIGAQMYINPLTAWIICKYVLNVKVSNFVAINASGSNLGKALIQINHSLGANIIAIVRNNRNIKLLKELGAQYVVNTENQSVYNEIMRITKNQGVNFAIDSIGGASGMNLAKSVKKNGNFVAVGLLSNQQVDWKFISENLCIQCGIFHLRHWMNSNSILEKSQEFNKLFSMVKNNMLQISTHAKIYPIDKFKFAINDSLNEDIKEKIFLRLTD
ncbi:zinc-dependent alcohol dehydrogenase family protein [Leuconostoc mesenteroides]|uniref:zinc-dependent alcohol dehydrogenase family protein n=1 Tax=Leuconostoc mesenteroides TaxID=1245 RepID=UPI0012398231|nr:zinc-dependent alcohol dehydrogenase family protein [Leuconostoc mesenteroides]KAA8347031.1 zinc-dependent alcohol dehydrogenase family protein [Leuconostoc mesenteroides]QHM55931.1 2-haloacrylate reductase [Leuconostoc mesenteroides]